MISEIELFEGLQTLLVKAGQDRERSKPPATLFSQVNHMVCVPKQVKLFMMERRSRSVEGRETYIPFAASIILIQTFQPKASRTFWDNNVHFLV